MNGGFKVPAKGVAGPDYKPEIVVCADTIVDYNHFESVVVHELIHAVDQCRVKKADWSNGRVHACSEVRASNLSGECKLGTEVMRGNFKLGGGQKGKSFLVALFGRRLVDEK